MIIRDMIGKEERALTETAQTSERKTKRRPFRFGLALFLLLLGAAAGIGVSYIFYQREANEPEPTVTYDLLEQQLRYVQDLITVEYHYTNMGKFENQLDFHGWALPFTVKSFIISYDGVIRVGVNMNGMSIRIDEDARVITMTFPQSAIISHEILEETIHVFDESRNLFNPITISDFTDFTKDQKSVMEQRAIDGGLLTEANERASLAIQSLLDALPETRSYQINIRVVS